MVLNYLKNNFNFKTITTLKHLESIYATMIKLNFNQDSYLTSQFITSCSSFRRTDHASLAFTQMREPNEFVYNAIIRASVQSQSSIQALEFYLLMLRTQVLPSTYTFSSLIKACRLVPDLGYFGEGIHCHVLKNGFGDHVFLQTGLIDFYSNLSKIVESRKVFDEMCERDIFALTTMISAHARAGEMDSARVLFDEMTIRNTDTWNVMTDGYAKLGDVESAELLFHRMPTKDLISWTTMINCYAKSKQFIEALAIFSEMRESKINPDEITISTVISACAHLGSLCSGKEIHLYLTQNGFDIDEYIGSALINMYAKCGSLDRSLIVFYKLRYRNLFCWNAIIEGLAVHGYAKEALDMFSRMESENVKPNGITFISILSACTHAGLVEEGRKRFAGMTHDYSIYPEIEHYGCMVDLLSKAGFLQDALDLINDMKIMPNARIWGALLGGCNLYKNMKIAEIAVGELKVLEPNNSGHFSLSVNMYAEVKQWQEVAKIRTRMKELGVEKSYPGSSSIEMDNGFHQFVASDKSHHASSEIYSLLDELYGQLKLATFESEMSSVIL